MSGFTEGEWRIIREPFRVSVESDDDIIYERYLSDVDDQDAQDELQEALATAGLVHAAPDLLFALQEMVDAYEFEASSENSALICAISAINKATKIQ